MTVTDVGRVEAHSGMALVPGTVFICPGGEHMNFKTSKAYPREGEIDAAIAAWGGSINGYTWIDTTTHYSIALKEGLEEALNRKKQKNRKPRIIDGEAEAQLIAIACSDPPKGRVRWTLKLLAREIVEREIVPSVCAETVRTTLKKTMSNRG